MNIKIDSTFTNFRAQTLLYLFVNYIYKKQKHTSHLYTEFHKNLQSNIYYILWEGSVLHSLYLYHDRRKIVHVSCKIKSKLYGSTFMNQYYSVYDSDKIIELGPYTLLALSLLTFIDMYRYIYVTLLICILDATPIFGTYISNTFISKKK